MSIGDQTYFYIFRGRLPRWLARFPSLQGKTAPLIERVRRHAALMVLLIRFAPALLILVAWFGPTYLAQFGLDGWKGALAIGLVILGVCKALGSYERRVIEPAE